MAIYHFKDVTIDVFAKLTEIDPRYVRALQTFSARNAAADFKSGKPVPEGMAIAYQGRHYMPGESRLLQAPVAAARAAGKARNADAPQSPAKAASAPTLDMFDNTDPNAPRTTDQNNAFWGLMEKLGKLTGKTGEEMKPVVVTRALGENKGTSKLTIAEMEKVIGFMKETIALFEAHDWATKSEGVKA